MSLTLIKEADVLSKLDAPALAAFTAIKTATGKETIAELVVEAFTPPYRKYLRTIVGYVKDFNAAGPDVPLNLSRKNDFLDVAGAVLENDPAAPPIEMHGAILNKLWADYKASKQHSKVMKLASAHEEEEFDSVDDIGDEDHTDHENNSGEEFYDPAERFGAAEAPADEEPTDDENMCVCPECGHEFSPDEAHGSDEDLEPEGEDHIIDNEDTGNRVSGAERLGRMGNGPDGGHVGDEPLAHEEEEHSMYRARGPMTARPGEEIVQSPKSILQQVLTAPKEQMTAALKDIETDGASAWKAAKLPENPHQKGSIAHRKWAAGFKRAMKSHLGLDVAPATVKPKRR